MALSVVFAALVVEFVGERPALADGPPEATTAAQKAKQHYLKGEAYFKAHDFSAAMGEYLSGYEEKPDPVFIFNVAQCQRLLGHPGPALQSYRRYLAEAPEGAGRAIAEKQVAELEKLAGDGDDAHPAPGTTVFGPTAVVPGGGGPEPPRPPPPTETGGEASPAASSAVVPPAPATSLLPAAASPPVTPGRGPALISLTPPAAGTSSSASPSGLLVTGAENERRPIYKQWWFWTAAGAVSLFALVAIASSSGDRPACDPGRLCR